MRCLYASEIKVNNFTSAQNILNFLEKGENKMKRSLQNGKRRILSVAMIALFIVIAASFGVTFAILASKTEVGGQDFTIGSLKIDVKDGSGTAEGKFTYDNTSDLSEKSEIKMTGSIALKDKSVTSFLRIKPTITFSGVETTEGIEDKKTEFINAFLEQIFGSSDDSINGVFKQGGNNVREWFKPTDGGDYYYYAGKFTSGESGTKSVLDGTIIMPNVDAFQNSSFTVSFSIEAIQASAVTDWADVESGTTQQKVDKLASKTDLWALVNGNASSGN